MNYLKIIFQKYHFIDILNLLYLYLRITHQTLKYFQQEINQLSICILHQTNSKQNANLLSMNPEQQTLQQYYERLIDQQCKEKNNNSDFHEQLISQFHTMNRNIQKKLQHYSKLISAYIGKVQKSFLVSFTKVLQKMGNDLMVAEQAYKSIDKEIMAKEKCVNLTNDKLFFINESNYYKKQFQFKIKQLEKLKEKNFFLIKENAGLKDKLAEKIKQNMFFKQKCKKLQKLNQKSSFKSDLFAKDIGEQSKPTSPSKFSNRNVFARSQQKKWSGYGRQTVEQKRQQQEQKQNNKKNLLVNIRKQLNTRQRFNLESIINRSLIKDEENNELSDISLKKIKIIEKNEPYTERLFRSFKQKQFDQQNKSLMSSTVASNFPHSYTNQSFNQRSIHSSVDKR